MARRCDDTSRPMPGGPADAAICSIAFRCDDAELAQTWCSEATLVSLSAVPILPRRLQALASSLAWGAATAREASCAQALAFLRQPLAEAGTCRVATIAAPASRCSELCALSELATHACFLVTDHPGEARALPPGIGGVLQARRGESLDDTAITLLQMLTALVGPSTNYCLDVEDLLEVFRHGPAELARAWWMPDNRLVFCTSRDRDLVQSASRALAFVPEVTMLAEEDAIFRTIQALMPPGAAHLRMDCPGLFLPSWASGALRNVSILCCG